MSAEFRKGDVCSLEVTVDDVPDSMPSWAVVRTNSGESLQLLRKDLTLLRRAPVDLVTCEIPKKGVEVYFGGSDQIGNMVGRGPGTAFVRFAMCDLREIKLEKLRPLDAPAPAPDQSAQRDMAAENERLKVYMRLAKEHCRNRNDVSAQMVLDEALASTAPTCPPCHIMINGRAVPEPMREAPEMGARYWNVDLDTSGLVQECVWAGLGVNRLRRGVNRLRRGLIHSTEAAARTHAEAIIAPSKREG